MSLVHTGTCLNCGAVLTGAYCASCGQKQAQTDLTLREFFHETTHELVHWDGKIPGTIKALFLHPGLLTVDFLKGRRARWLLPLRVYLICSVAYFVSLPVAEKITGRSFRPSASVRLTNSDGTPVTTITPEIHQQIAEGLPGRIFGADRLERAFFSSNQLSLDIRNWFPRAMFVLLPLFALLTNLAWRRKQPRYPAHLYMALHLHAAWFAAFAVAIIATMAFRSDAADGVLMSLAIAYILWYTMMAMRRVFGESWVRTVLKATAIAAIYLPSVLSVGMLMLLYWITTR
jgi:uncharacterized protein DUF3667